MVLTTKEQLKFYTSLNPYFEKAFAALAELEKEEFVKGRHEVDGSNIYINALEYDTKNIEDAKMEAHRAYIDVMWMVSGEEIIGVVPSDELTEITKEYDPKGDAFLAKLPAAYTPVRMKPNSVCILFPEDGHAPCMDADKKDHVRKLIAKVRVV